jgi:dihydroorotate dehydrogenase (NAD+) catalytic subunit
MDLRTRVGSIELPNPVMTASGTAGHGVELGAYFDLDRLGAHVVKSICAEPWAGNRPPRLHPLAVGMLNSVGLQGPGVKAWADQHLDALEKSGARVVLSIWGRTVEEFARAAEMVKAISPAIVAIEVNVSCPNIEDRSRMFAHSPAATGEVIDAMAVTGYPLWAKLSPNTAELLEVADAAYRAGAQSLTLTNTLLGLAIDLDTRRPALGAGGGGLSGPALHPVAVRAVYECYGAFRRPIVGVGGVSRARDAIEFFLAGACAVGIGSAVLAEPRTPLRVLKGIARYGARHGIASLDELIGAAHD